MARPDRWRCRSRTRRRRWARETDEDRDHVDDQDSQIASPGLLWFLALPGVVEMFATRVFVEREPEDANGEQCEPVHRDEHSLAVDVVERFGDEPRRERQEAHAEQDEEVESQQDRVCPSEPIRQCGMGEPRAADRQEADEVGEVVGPRFEHLLQWTPRRMESDVQDEQRGRDGEHAVAERFQPCLAERHSRTRCIFLVRHSTLRQILAPRRTGGTGSNQTPSIASSRPERIASQNAR